MNLAGPTSPRLTAAVLTLAVLAGFALVAASAARAQTIGFTVDQPLPNVGDQIHLESDALKAPPYNVPGRYVLWIYFCADTLENCRTHPELWRRAPVTDAAGAATVHECTRGHCDLRIRLGTPREGTYTFIATVREPATGAQVARSNPLEVRWVRPPPQQAQQPSGPFLTLVVEGVSCTVRFGTSNNRCSVGNPTGAAVVRINPDGTARGPRMTATMGGYPLPQWGIVVTWQGRQWACPGATTCSPALTGWETPFFGTPPADFKGRLQVGAGLAYNHTAGERGSYGETLLGPLEAEVWVDYIAPTR